MPTPTKQTVATVYIIDEIASKALEKVAKVDKTKIGTENMQRVIDNSVVGKLKTKGAV